MKSGQSYRIQRILLERLKLFHGNDVETAKRELGWMTEASPPCNKENLLKLRKMVKNRCSSMPLAYAIGTQPFGSLELTIKPPVLIPRPETEEWAMQLASEYSRWADEKGDNTRNPIRVLDLCTGSGCIAATFAAVLPKKSAKIIAVDINHRAIEIAKENTRLVKSNNSVEVIQADIMDKSFPNLGIIHDYKPFDLIVSNPPYIPYRDWVKLDRSVKDWESPLALLSSKNKDDDGLAFYHCISQLVPSLLNLDSGKVVVEIGADQGKAVRSILQNSVSNPPYKAHASIHQDCFGRDRYVVFDVSKMSQ